MFNEMNRVRSVREGIDTSAMTFKPLKDFCGQTIHVDGFFFTSGKYGEQTVIVGSGYLINMPTWATEVFRQIAADKEQLEAVLAGKLVINEIKMVKTKNGTTCSYKLADA